MVNEIISARASLQIAKTSLATARRVDCELLLLKSNIVFIGNEVSLSMTKAYQRVEL